MTTAYISYMYPSEGGFSSITFPGDTVEATSTVRASYHPPFFETWFNGLCEACGPTSTFTFQISSPYWNANWVTSSQGGRSTWYNAGCNYFDANGMCSQVVGGVSTTWNFDTATAAYRTLTITGGLSYLATVTTTTSPTPTTTTTPSPTPTPASTHKHPAATSTDGTHPAAAATPASSSSPGISSGAKAGIGVGLTLAVLLAAAVLLYWWRRRRRRVPPILADDSTAWRYEANTDEWHKRGELEAPEGSRVVEAPSATACAEMGGAPRTVELPDAIDAAPQELPGSDVPEMRTDK